MIINMDVEFSMNKKQLLIGWILIHFLLIGSIRASGNEEEPIEVKLATESPLMPLYLLPFIHTESLFPPSYLKQLQHILAFDLSHNGATSLSKNSFSTDQLANPNIFEDLGSVIDWRTQAVCYVVRVRVKGDHLSAFILTVNDQSLKGIEDISLTGQLNQDRRHIHRLADTIHQALFGTEGIASTHLLYTVKHQEKEGRLAHEVWETDYDGANARPLIRHSHLCVNPAYIPPKPGYLTGGFMYVSFQLGQPKIYVVSLSDCKERRLTFLRGNQFMPAISQQRDKVAFISDVTGNPDLFLQPFSPEKGAIGKPQQIFSVNRKQKATQSSPTFSPDGKRVAFVSDKDGSPRIYVMEIPPPGTSLKEIKTSLISKRNRESTAPNWSPDGSKIAYCAKTNGYRQIWIYDFNTHEERQLTQGPGHKENPAWAPNSLHLVFNSVDEQGSELYLINLHQTEAIQITFGEGEKRFPAWEPRTSR
jgi:TolB protein